MGAGGGCGKLKLRWHLLKAMVRNANMKNRQGKNRTGQKAPQMPCVIATGQAKHQPRTRLQRRINFLHVSESWTNTPLQLSYYNHQLLTEITKTCCILLRSAGVGRRSCTFISSSYNNIKSLSNNRNMLRLRGIESQVKG